MLIFRPRKRFTTLASVRLTGLRRRCSLLSEKWGELFHILNLIKIMMEQSSHTLRILKGYRNLSSNVYIDLLYTLSYEDMTLQEFTEMIRTDPANFFDSPEGVDWLVISSIIFDPSWNFDPQSCYKRSTTSSRARLMGSCSKFSTTSQKQRWKSCQWEFQIYKSFSSIIMRFHRL